VKRQQARQERGSRTGRGGLPGAARVAGLVDAQTQGCQIPLWRAQLPALFLEAMVEGPRGDLADVQTRQRNHIKLPTAATAARHRRGGAQQGMVHTCRCARAEAPVQGLLRELRGAAAQPHTKRLHHGLREGGSEVGVSLCRTSANPTPVRCTPPTHPALRPAGKRGGDGDIPVK
jgi:hypothetical protein